MRYSFHIIPILIVGSALGYQPILGVTTRYKKFNFILLISLVVFLLIRPIHVFNNFSYIKSDKGFFYANYAMPLLGMNKYNTDLYKGYIQTKNNISKNNFILYEKGFYLDEEYKQQRLINFISIDTINEYDPDYFIFTKLMTGRFCWLDKIVTCREDIREDLKINTKETLKYFG